MATTEDFLKRIEELLPPFYADPGFWIGVFGLLISLLAWFEAGNAKRAAEKAAQVTKTQTAIADLNEMGAIMEIGLGIAYGEARFRLNTFSARFSRQREWLEHRESQQTCCIRLARSITRAEKALEGVSPMSGVSLPDMVYLGIEGPFGDIRKLVAELAGKLEVTIIGTNS